MNRILKVKLNRTQVKNWLHFVALFFLVTVNSIFVTALDFNGLEWLIGVPIYVFLMWSFRVSFVSKNNKLDKVEYSFNLLGVYFLKVKHGGKTWRTKSRDKNIVLGLEDIGQITIDAVQLHKSGPLYSLS